MPSSVQEFLASATQRAAADLVTAVLRLPEDKRSWSPMDMGRTALDQAAECAILSGRTADTIKTRTIEIDMQQYMTEKADLARDWNAVKALLEENTAKVAAAIRQVPDEDMGVVIQFPWGPMTLAQVIAYPHWNMSYHEGQVNYIASLIGCL